MLDETICYAIADYVTDMSRLDFRRELNYFRSSPTYDCSSTTEFQDVPDYACTCSPWMACYCGRHLKIDRPEGNPDWDRLSEEFRALAELV